jgi:hypothetical protein
LFFHITKYTRPSVTTERMSTVPDIIFFKWTETLCKITKLFPTLQTQSCKYKHSSLVTEDEYLIRLEQTNFYIDINLTNSSSITFTHLNNHKWCKNIFWQITEGYMLIYHMNEWMKKNHSMMPFHSHTHILLLGRTWSALQTLQSYVCKKGCCFLFCL